MVYVGGKDPTSRRALAASTLLMGEAAFAALASGRSGKGEVLAVARVAGIQAAKRTADLVPLCHPLSLDQVSVRFSLEPERRALRIEAEARAQGRTGVEMEALTAVSVAALTVYDMLKSLDRGMRIAEILLLEKDGGKSGAWKRDA
jgi:cyclic pyranopterin phosphate synthase